MTQKGEVQAWMRNYVAVVTPESGCTDWPFAVFPRTGRACARNPRRGQIEMAGRTTWEILHGEPFPEGKQARHLCGNGHLGCANPYHIVPGTHAENVEDRARDGRTLRGEAHPMRTSTEEQIIQACHLIASGVPLGQAAARVGLTKYVVSNAWRGRGWPHLDMPRRADVERRCANCGEPMPGALTRRRFCDEKCSWTYRNRARRAAASVTRAG